MALKKTPVGGEISPSGGVDMVWHEHLLDTRGYRELYGDVEHDPDAGKDTFAQAERYAKTISLLGDEGTL